MKWNLLFFIFSIFIPGGILAQNLYINKYTQKDYGSHDFDASPQNWEIEQDSLGRIYVANSSGIMLFDGAVWHMVAGAENQNLFAMAKTASGTIFTGGRIMGYL
jgi:hypothetical protein